MTKVLAIRLSKGFDENCLILDESIYALSHFTALKWFFYDFAYQILV